MPEPWYFLCYNQNMGFFRNDAFLGRVTMLTGFLLLVTLVILAVFFDKLPPSVPLWVTLPWGERQLAPKVHVWTVQGIAAGVWIGNLVLGRLFFRTPALSRLFVGMSLILAFVTLAVVVRLIGVFLV